MSRSITKKAILTLTCMNDWMTAAEVAKIRNACRTPTARTLALLIEKGLVEVAHVNEGQVKHRSRRSEAGSQLIGVYSPREIKKAEVKVERRGDNPFEWRSYKQPFPWQEDPYPNQHREVSEKATFYI